MTATPRPGDVMYFPAQRTAEDTRPVIVVGTCHDCDTHGPVALIPVWEAPGVRGLDDAVCLPCAATRLTSQRGAW